MEEPERVVLDLGHLIPTDWFGDAEGNSIWISAFQMVRVASADIPSGVKIFDLPRVRLILIYGSVPYLDRNAATPRVTSAGEFVINTTQLQAWLPEGAYLLLVFPFNVAGQPGDEAAVRNKISELGGFLAALNSPNMVYQHLFDNELDLDTGNLSVVTDSVVDPFALPIPDITDSRLQILARIFSILENLPPSSRSKAWLSLRWFQAGLNDSGVDAYLKTWIALETLAMPNTTDIRPVNEQLAQVYGISFEQARSDFYVGRLYGIRNRIVHNGEQLIIDAHLIDYLGAIYIDMLLATAGLSAEWRARTLLNSDDFNYGAYLSSL